MVNYDSADGTDATDAADKAQQIKVNFDRSDVRFWVRSFEVRMEFAGVKSQWLKRLCLQNAIPADVMNCMKDLLVKTKSEVGENELIYKSCKDRLIKCHGPNPEDDFQKAQTLTFTGKPSDAAKRIVELVCQKNPPLANCCCATAVGKLWRDMLPPLVRAAVAGADLKTEWTATLDRADAVYAGQTDSANHVAAVTVQPATPAATPLPPQENETASVTQLAEQLAAFTKKFNNIRGKSQRGRGAARGRTANAASQKEKALPNACWNHKRHGKQAFFCAAEDTCPWKEFIVKRE